MKKLFATKKGIDVLQNRRLEWMGKLKYIQGQKGEAAEVGGNQWHDNFSFEDLCRQESVANKQISDISRQLSLVVEVPAFPRDIETLKIGHVAHLYIEEDKEMKVVIVGGLCESDLTTNPQTIEYIAPLLLPFFGQSEGYEHQIKIRGGTKTVTLEKIELRG